MTSDVLILGTGSLARHLLLSLTADAEPRHVVVVGRCSERATALARYAFAAAGPDVGVSVRAVSCGLEGLAELIDRLAPRIVVTCASLHSPWEPRSSPSKWTRLVEQAGPGFTVPLQCMIAVQVAQALRAVRSEALHLNACLPDLVNPILVASELPVLCGLGNVQTLAMAVKSHREETDAKLSLGMMAHHYHLRSVVNPRDEARVWAGATPVGGITEALMPFRRIPRRDRNPVTARAAGLFIRGLLTGEPVTTNAPGPLGLPGGYPISVRTGEVHLELPAGLTIQDAVAANERWAYLDHLGTVSSGVVTLYYHPDVGGAPEWLRQFSVADLVTVVREFIALRDHLRQFP